MQTKKMSLVESLVNIAIGYTLNLLAQTLIFPLFGIYISFSKNLGIGLAFTLISLGRSYVIRRWFNSRW